MTFQVHVRSTTGAVTGFSNFGGVPAAHNPQRFIQYSGGSAPTDEFRVELETNAQGRASFVVAAPADPNPSNSGDSMNIIVYVIEEVNGPVSSTNTNKRLHHFVIEVNDQGARLTSGTAPTTTIPAGGNAATAFTVAAIGAKTAKTFPAPAAPAAALPAATFVDATFDEPVGLKIQLKDSDGADTTRGTSAGPAQFLVRRFFQAGVVNRINSMTSLRWTGSPPPGALLWVDHTERTKADGSATVGLEFEDPAQASGTKRSIAFIIEAWTNAPGNDDDHLTAGIVRFTEP